MKSLAHLVAVLNKNPVFKFIASVRLAVPLMLVIAGIVATGTIYESLYNTEVARITVYRTWWFELVMILLWLNIFAAALSRFPWKKHQTGFVITHLGLLTLLIGGQITSSYGIDGQLRIIEGDSSKAVTLDKLVLKVIPREGDARLSYPIARTLTPRSGDQLRLGELRDLTGLSAVSLLPFVAEETAYVAGPSGESEARGVALTFNMQSPFFNFSESVHTLDRPELQMGPAHFRIIDDADRAAAAQPSRRGSTVEHAAAAPKAGRHGATEPILIAHDAATGEALQSIPLSQLKQGPVTVHGTTVTLTRAYRHAAVSDNKLVDRGTDDANPALDMQVTRSGQRLREIVFALFPTFALNPQGALGLKFELQVAGLREAAEAAAREREQAAEARAGGPGAAGPNGNTVEFHVRHDDASKLRLVLTKAGARVAEKTVTPGETFVTPWMGIRITVTSLVPGGVQTTRVKPVEMQARMPLPPSALELRSDATGQTTWLVEGDARTIVTSRGPLDVYYGRDSVQLPFTVKLQQFRKTDYPGTDTPMSFESTILPERMDAPVVVKMNEPFRYEGYLLYQSSYEMGPDMPTASIFSVNLDPGRTVKYLGAIILVIGIALFTIMRSKWYAAWSRGPQAARLERLFLRPLRKFPVLLLAAAALPGAGAGTGLGERDARADAPTTYSAFSPEAARAEFTRFASRVDVAELARLPVQSRGRVKPLDSLAREILVYLTGKSSLWGLDPVQIVVSLAASPSGPYLELVNVRDPDLRVKLGFSKAQRQFTFTQMRSSGLEELARPLLPKQEENEKSLSESEKKILEAFQQTYTLGLLLSGSFLRDSVLLDVASMHGAAHQPSPGAQLAVEKMSEYVLRLENGDVAGANQMAPDLVSVARAQPMPELFRGALGKMGVEVLYNHLKLFFIAGVLYLLLGVAFVSGLIRKKLSRPFVLGLLALPVALHVTGFALRVYITGFAPVTNMYGTMVWMALGVVVFGTLLFALYQDLTIYGLLLIGSSITLLLTENLPLILSPDMDPIVAVLRNNFWLTIHVLTISISYAAFTIAMLIGNASLVRALASRGRVSDAETVKRQAHIAYRAMQLGVFLLTTGIILGGWWADYSWGRFWGWDPKETWALIADLGYLAILHARYVGWLGPAGVLAAAPMAYLLVIMAWYGVNFILAAGLHSYGFSSGGATAVMVFVGLQLALFALAWTTRSSRRRAH